ncbi:MAG: MarR family transcriptional regulator [Nocardioidaceae bacterium]|nr:MarR family transcriptional regulator [Nocardioidaceae bacterium]
MTTHWLSTDQQRVWRAYLVGTTLLMDQLERDLRDGHDLSLPEYEILVRLSEAPQRRLRMAELANSVKNSRSRITHTIARMERQRLVQRRQCPSDGRGVFAALTDVGYDKLVETAPAHVGSVRAALIDAVAPEDLEAVGRAFSAVAARLETGAPDPILSPTVV